MSSEEIMNEVANVQAELDGWVDEMIDNLRRNNDDGEVIASLCRFLSIRAMDPSEALGMAGTLSVALYRLAKQKMSAQEEACADGD